MSSLSCIKVYNAPPLLLTLIQIAAVINFCQTALLIVFTAQYIVFNQVVNTFTWSRPTLRRCIPGISCVVQLTSLFSDSLCTLRFRIISNWGIMTFLFRKFLMILNLYYEIHNQIIYDDTQYLILRHSLQGHST